MPFARFLPSVGLGGPLKPRQAVRNVDRASERDRRDREEEDEEEQQIHRRARLTGARPGLRRGPPPASRPEDPEADDFDSLTSPMEESGGGPAGDADRGDASRLASPGFRSLEEIEQDRSEEAGGARPRPARPGLRRGPPPASRPEDPEADDFDSLTSPMEESGGAPAGDASRGDASRLVSPGFRSLEEIEQDRSEEAGGARPRPDAIDALLDPDAPDGPGDALAGADDQGVAIAETEDTTTYRTGSGGTSTHGPMVREGVSGETSTHGPIGHQVLIEPTTTLGETSTRGPNVPGPASHGPMVRESGESKGLLSGPGPLIPQPDQHGPNVRASEPEPGPSLLSRLFSPQAFLEDAKAKAETVGKILTLPHHAAWAAHDYVTGQTSEKDPTQRSFDKAGKIHLAHVVPGLVSDWVREKAPRAEIDTLSLVLGQDWARAYDDDKQISGLGDYLSVGGTVLEAVPITKLLTTPLKATKTVLPTRLGGGFTADTTPRRGVRYLEGSHYSQEVLDAANAAKRQLNETGQATVTVGDDTYHFRQSRLDEAIRAAQKEDVSLAGTASPDVSVFEKGGEVPILKTPDGTMKPPVEQGQFLSPGGEANYGFTIKSAYGHTGENPGIAVYKRGMDDLELAGTPDSPLGVKGYVKPGIGPVRELELIVPTGDITAPLRPVTNIGEGAKLYLDEALEAPSYLQRVRANVLAATDALSGQQSAATKATPEDIARSQFGKELSDLTLDEAHYVNLAQQGDDALRHAMLQGDESAEGILRTRTEIRHSTNLAEQGDDALRRAMLQGDETAEGILRTRTEIRHSTNLAEQSDDALRRATLEGDESARDILRSRADEGIIRRVDPDNVQAGPHLLGAGDPGRIGERGPGDPGGPSDPIPERYGVRPEGASDPIPERYGVRPEGASDPIPERYGVRPEGASDPIPERYGVRPEGASDPIPERYGVRPEGASDPIPERYGVRPEGAVSRDTGDPIPERYGVRPEGASDPIPERYGVRPEGASDPIPERYGVRPEGASDPIPERYGVRPEGASDPIPERYGVRPEGAVSRDTGDPIPERYGVRPEGAVSRDTGDPIPEWPGVRPEDAVSRDTGDPIPERYGVRPEDAVRDTGDPIPERYGVRPEDASDPVPERHGVRPEDAVSRDTGGPIPERYGRVPVEDRRDGLPDPSLDRYTRLPVGEIESVPERTRARKRGLPKADGPLEKGPAAEPRPPGSFPRQIEHQEQVEYSYDPMTDTYDAQLVASSEPVVTEWDKSSPSRDEREVGTWDVTPADDGVIVQNRERVTIPDAVKARLKQAADERGEAVSETSTLRFNHDLDTRETEHHARRSTAELAAALMARKQRDSTQDDALGERFQKLAERFQRQQLQTRAAAKNRRSSRSKEKEKEGGYKLPTIVITQEAGGSTRRVGGL